MDSALELRAKQRALTNTFANFVAKICTGYLQHPTGKNPFICIPIAVFRLRCQLQLAVRRGAVWAHKAATHLHSLSGVFQLHTIIQTKLTICTPDKNTLTTFPSTRPYLGQPLARVRSPKMAQGRPKAVKVVGFLRVYKALKEDLQ